MMRRAAAAALAVVTVGVAGCSGNHANPQTPWLVQAQAPAPFIADASRFDVVPDRLQLGQEYRRIVGPANAALAAMAKGFASVPASATVADITKLTDPAADASKFAALIYASPS